MEATMDKYWAAFATPTSKSIANGTWKGANRLGILLMELRNELRREYHDAIPDQQVTDQGMEVSAPSTSGSNQSQKAQPDASTKPVAPSRNRKNKHFTDEDLHQYSLQHNTKSLPMNK